MKFNPQVIDAMSSADFEDMLSRQFALSELSMQSPAVRFGKAGGSCVTLRQDAVRQLLGITQSQLIHLIRVGKLSRPFIDIRSRHAVWQQQEIEPFMKRAPEPKRPIGFLGQ